MKSDLTKDDIITIIENRIKDEHRKHPTLEWEKIAAHKIYSSLFTETKINENDSRIRNKTD